MLVNLRLIYVRTYVRVTINDKCIHHSKTEPKNVLYASGYITRTISIIISQVLQKNTFRVFKKGFHYHLFLFSSVENKNLSFLPAVLTQAVGTWKIVEVVYHFKICFIHAFIVATVSRKSKLVVYHISSARF